MVEFLNSLVTFPLQIFPQGALASSVITTIWVGIFVVAFFNLRFGWILSGLVVPGYLVPLLLIKPWAVLAIFIEGVTAYYLVWLFSEYFSRYGLWSALFGRDRFFALILASIATRVAFDGWVLPWFGMQMQDFGIVFDYRNELHSLGLIIVALVANQFWKTGLLKGLPPFIVTIGVTWLIVKYILLPYTNFGLGGLSYMYEDIAVSILASPKAYIILVTTAFVASRMNLHYGWDFNGILIPALLALQWYEPSKIVISFVESFIILGLAVMTLKLPIFANSTIEGARKLLLFFNISFVYKIALSHILVSYFSGVKVTDFFAFGYLLSTLLAIKMHDNNIAIRLTRATVQTSFVSIVIASAIGFCLTFLPSFQPWASNNKIESASQVKVVETTLLERILAIKTELYRSRFSEGALPLPQEIDLFNQASKLLLEYVKTREAKTLHKAIVELSRVDYQVEILEKQYLLLSQIANNKYWGVYIINLEAENDLLLEIPSPQKDRGLVGASAVLLSNLKARALSIAGGNLSPFQNQTFFDGFHKVAGRRDVLQIHSYSKEISRALTSTKVSADSTNLRNAAGINANASTFDSAKKSGEIWVKKRLPPSLDLAALERLVGKFEINWGEIDYTNLQRDVSREGYAELILNRKGMRKLLISPLTSIQQTELKVDDQRIDGYLQEWLLGSKGQIAESGTNAYIVPLPEELLYFDEEILTPLVSIIDSGFINQKWTVEALEELQTVNIAAQVFGYELVRYVQSDSDKHYLILSESNQTSRRYWGTYVFRLGDTSPFIIQSPRPLFEVNSFEVAVSLFERMQSSALLIGGTHPLTNQDYSSDLVRSGNKGSLFTLVNQVLMRERYDSPLLSIQCRALGQQIDQPLPNADMLVSFDDGAVEPSAFNILQQTLLNTLKTDNWLLEFVDGSIDTSGYQVGGTPQARYVKASENKGFALLWVSPLVRSSFKQQREDDSLSMQFLALGINSVESDLYQSVIGVDVAITEKVATSIVDLVAKYQDTLDVVLLKKLLSEDQYLSRVIDKHSKQAFLLLHDKKGQLSLVANLNPLDIKTQKTIAIDNLNRDSINEFIEARTARLVIK
jgi:hypothetical protein